VFTYRARVTEVYDGDTVTVDVDLGFTVTVRALRLRLSGIDTPEIRTRDKQEKLAGYKARDWLREQIDGKEIMVRTEKTGKHGRYIATIWSIDENGTRSEESLNDEMLRNGLARVYGWKNKE